MKVGDLVRKTYWNTDVGVIIEQQAEDPHLGMYWRVLFGDNLIYQRESDLEVISENR